MSEDRIQKPGKAPEPGRDQDIPRAPGGPDAVPEESDVGATGDSEGLLTPDQPLSAQQDTDEVPSSIQESEEVAQTSPDTEQGGAAEATD